MMSIAEPITSVEPKPKRRGRPWNKALMMLLRRGHLYLGLFLFPWAVLYGVTAFLFNHPTAFSDEPTVQFDAEVLEGTELAALPTPTEQAQQVVAQLNAIQQPVTPYRVVGKADYPGRSFAFATVKQETQTISVLYDVKTNTGTIRVTANPVDKATKPTAPFATASPPMSSRQPPGNSGQGKVHPHSLAIKLDSPIHERFKLALPIILERCNFPSDGIVTVTSVPNVEFPIEADGNTWEAAYNDLTGAVTGTEPSNAESNDISIRRFLLRLHLAHGYPGETNSRWFWAVIVDAMAFTMCFWGISGLLMWWQIKATRRIGAIILLLSTSAAIVLGMGMHSALSGG